MIGALVFGIGCGGAQIEPPGDDSGSQGDAESTGTGTSTTGTGSTTSVTGDDSTTEVGTTAPTTTGEGTTTDTGGEACIGPDGCFDCAPKQPLEVLNACTDAACSAYENTQKRLPLLKDDGTLPPLP